MGKPTYWSGMFAAIGTLTDFHAVLEVGESVTQTGLCCSAQKEEYGGGLPCRGFS